MYKLVGTYNTGALVESGVGEKINIKNPRFQLKQDKIVDIGTSAAANIHLTMRIMMLLAAMVLLR